MTQAAIDAFFAERREAWLKKSVKTSMSESEVVALEQECETIFAMADWLPKAAKRAGQINMATHPCTFSHPSSRKNKNGYVTPVTATQNAADDGFIRTGNVLAELDALGNAAAIDVYKFLNITLDDGRTLITHIAEDSDIAMALLTVPTATYAELKQGFMEMTGGGGETITSSKIKQVFFPVEHGEYHQLSLLTNSGIVYRLRKQIDDMRFSEEVKNLRALKNSNSYSPVGYREIFDITTIGYGGTKPQNISILNNQNGGKAHLLSSIPPTFAKTTIPAPNKDVFKGPLSPKRCTATFEKMHRIFLATPRPDLPREKLRKGLQNCLADLLNYAIEKAMQWQAVASEQTHRVAQLPRYQQLWLNKALDEDRLTDNEWLAEVSANFTQWVVSGYNSVIEDAVVLGTEEQAWIQQWVEQQQEVFKL